MPRATALLQHTLHTLREHLAMVLGLSLLALLCLSWSPVALLLHLTLPRRWGQPLGRRVATGCFRFYLWALQTFCGCRFDLGELDRLATQGPMIIVANHPSLLDALLLISRLPDVVCIMKAGLMDNPMFGAAARLARYIRNDTLLHVILHTRNTLREGGQVIVFPEGTRTARFPMNPILPSIGLLAMRTQAPVQTVLLEFSSPYLGKAWPLWRPPQLPLHVTARLGQRFDPPTNADVFNDTLQRYFDQALSPTPCPSPPEPTSS
ncbi:MAG: 1-acyl-sn-glycerol-3-phosphate acyltransferase [Hydrogenophaga sp.]|nr:1-acyl-sn-glycerol-3-phosphate acyltransferase [Hydrogenophaga sp.]